MGNAEHPRENDGHRGIEAEVAVASDRYHGLDPITLQLGVIAATFEDIQRTRKSAGLRRIAAEKQDLVATARLHGAIEESLKKTEESAGRALGKLLREHVLWPWLEPLKGLRGPLTARVISIIGHPHRFPGQPCTNGHIWPVGYEVGVTCPFDGTTENETPPGCTGTMLPPRPHSGTRSVWHYFGLHVVNGRSPRKRKGMKVDWSPAARTLVMQPDGIADQIVRQRTPVYREKYDATKERLQRTRGAEGVTAAEVFVGPALVTEGAEKNSASETSAGPLRLIQIHDIARKVAAKAFLADLLREWKRLT